MTETPTPSPAPVSFGEAFRVWARIGLMSFGGPAGQIALMHRILVDEKKWVSEGRFLHALNYCMLLPGPEAQQLATYVGWLLHRTAGGLAAGLLFVLPGAAVMWAFSVLYAGFADATPVQALFFGIKAAVLAVVVEAVFRIGKRALRNAAMVALAAAAFAAIFLFGVPFPAIVAGAALVGYLGERLAPDLFAPAARSGADAAVDAASPLALRDPVRPSPRRSVAVALAWLALWLGPLALLAAGLGLSHVFVQEGLFFSKMAVVTFGGAYAVLAYVAQQAVENFGWLEPGEMLDGLGLAETTPGPLIMVLQFVGFLAAYRSPGGLDPLLAGTLGAAIATWMTFAPCFLWIFLGAPYIEALRGNRTLGAALSAITAAVVGVILNLAAWFALHVIFARVEDVEAWGMRLPAPDPASADLAVAALGLAALVALVRFKANMLLVLASSAGVGAAIFYARLGA